MHAQDVIHGFYVPEFRLKQDIVPKRNIDIVLTPIRAGKYRLKDSQFSGTYFALMEADVYVESETQYNQWVAQVADTPNIPKNEAAAEYLRSPKTLFNTGWYTFAPADTDIAEENKVNHDT